MLQRGVGQSIYIRIREHLAHNNKKNLSLNNLLNVRTCKK